MYEIATRFEPRAARRWSPEKFDHFLFLMGRKKLKHVLLLDETDIVALHDAQTGGRLFGALSGAPGFRFVVAGHRVLRTEIRNPNSRLYNSVEPIYLGGIEDSSARSLIVEPMTDISLDLRDEKNIIKHILSQSARRPSIIQLYCRELVHSARQHGKNYGDFSKQPD